MMPNKTYELRNLYFQQSQYCAKQQYDSYYRPPLLQWPANGYFEKFKSDSDLFEAALEPDSRYSPGRVSDQVFGNQLRQQYTGLKHSAHLLYERAQLHKRHIQDIDSRHMNVQESLFGVKINNFPDKGKRQGTLEAQLLQLEQQRRDEELSFWKDTVELRQKLFEGAGEFSSAKARYSIFSGVEGYSDGRDF